MKKLLLIPALMLGTLAMANQYDLEITPVAGYNITEGNLDIVNHPLVGLEAQFNNVNSILKPELSVLYTNAELYNSDQSTNIYRIALNGVYEYQKLGFLIPLAKIGMGYETMSTKLPENRDSKNRDSMFGDVGVGAKIPFTDSIALKLEAVYMIKDNANRWDSNLGLLAGLNFAFGEKAAPVVVVVDGDDDNDGITNSVDKCPGTKANVAVDANGCEIDGDDDSDGVKNSMDKCPATPANTKVDANGCKVELKKVTEAEAPICPPKINLHINFKFDSAEVEQESLERVTKFADFLKCTPDYKAKIIGHTDSVGSETYNQKLSQRRADVVKSMIIKDGVQSNKITSSAKGESEPIATNKTDEGRAENRRIEAELTKN